MILEGREGIPLVILEGREGIPLVTLEGPATTRAHGMPPRSAGSCAAASLQCARVAAGSLSPCERAHQMPSAAACEAACVAPECAAWTYWTVQAPPPPPTPAPGPPAPHSRSGPGVDLRGEDLLSVTLNGSDVKTEKASEAACEKLCEARAHFGAAKERCVAWVISVAGCTSPGHINPKGSMCWLKAGGGALHAITNKCRVSGTMKAAAAAAAPPPPPPPMTNCKDCW